MWLLADCTVTGRENLPQKGPLILVGNHVAVLEAAMMVMYVPWIIELVGAGDIPIDQRFSWLVHIYGFIPIKRGDMDREALSTALEVLKHGGILGIFPEGGTWETTVRQGKTGVAWLSYQANAPIVPIGFGGIDGALGAALHFKRPKVVMNIGQVIPPVNPDLNGHSRKAVLEESAQLIMSRVEALIPEADKLRWTRIRDERFDLTIILHDPDGEPVEIPANLVVQRPDMLAKFFHRPLMLDVFARNLKLPVQPLQHLHDEHDPHKLADAADFVLGYLAEHPHFLTYRFGTDDGLAMEAGLRQLRDIGRWAELQACSLLVTPIRRYRVRGSDKEIVETYPGSLPAL
jgi:1-acyl-sn-glycerol-3-phosphate acyltransferase